MRVVVIGGVAGGMSAATRLRRLDESAEIIVLERSGYVSYANCGLPYYVGGVIEHEETLLLHTPASLHERFGLDVRVDSEAVALDPVARRVTVKNLVKSTLYDLEYDYLILSPGAAPVIPPIPGIERAMALRTVEDVEAIVASLADSPASAVVIGAGFIGVELVENLVHRGVATSLVEATDQILAPLDPEMVAPVAAELAAHGVSLYVGESVTRVGPDTVQLSSGVEVPAAIVIAAVGMRPETTLARAAGLALGPRGGIAVDAYHRTSVETIYAVGDAVETPDALDGGATLVPLANLANRHGRVVADHLTGRAVRPRGSIATAIIRVFGLTAAATGWNEKRLAAAQRPYVAIHTHPRSHANYYPGAQPMSLKLLADPATGQILGAQGVGRGGVDKRIDVIATAIRGGLSAPELADLELAYAPPFGSAKDPVNMLGYVADNVLSGLVETVQWSDVPALARAGTPFIDVRSPEEFARGALPDALNVPLDRLRDRVGELPADVVVYCQVGQRGHTAVRLLAGLGRRAPNLDGGYETWAASPAGSWSTRKVAADVS